MNPSIISCYKLKEINSKIVIFAFFSTLIFQITAYKFIWGIELLSRIVNLTLLMAFSAYALYFFISAKFNRKIFYFYITPGLLVYIGFFINITISSMSNIKGINQFGMLIPWAVYLAIPTLLKNNNLNVFSLWRYFNYFMLTTVSLSIFEYLLLFSGVINPRPINTDGGPFVAGYFSMLYAIESGELHHRFYASFMEPGTLAMFLLPVISYSFLYRKYLSLLVYLIALYLTDSLGGFISMLILMPLLVYFKFKKNVVPAVIFVLFVSFFVVTVYTDDLIYRYEERELSATVREDATYGFISNFPSLILDYPFGLPLKENTDESFSNPAYKGANFTIGNAFYLGGTLSFLGYIAVLFLSLWYAIFGLFRKHLSLDEQVVVMSTFCLLPFIVQRTVIWDSSIFAMLFAPFVVFWIQGRKINFN